MLLLSLEVGGAGVAEASETVIGSAYVCMCVHLHCGGLQHCPNSLEGRDSVVMEIF